jgi:pyridoxal phosphate enzyme (YggS family)
VKNALADRVAEVRERIASAAERSGRRTEAITLVAVSKTHPAEVIAAGVAAGLDHLGENRVQEAAVKKEKVPSATWHLIGPLQRNKAGLALELFDVIHTVDRPSIARRLQLLLERDWPGRRLSILIEVNIGAEPQKAGVLPDRLTPLAEEVLACPSLALDGLMVIPPFDQTSQQTRADFRRLRRLRDDLENRLGVALCHLSMGMSQDYEMAIEEGATMVRVGTALFGPRGTPLA